MSRQSRLKLIHFASTAWFMLCIGYIMILTLRQAGFRWWVIFSLSGHSATLILFLVTLYLFAFFRGIDRGQQIEKEHPFTKATCYTIFYDVSPFLGGFAGYLASIGISRTGELLLAIALGTFVTTFLVWIIVDPIIGVIERHLPASKKLRLERLAQVKALRQKQQEEQKRLLAEAEARDQLELSKWQQILQPDAEKLAGLLTARNINSNQMKNQVVDIGANAWRIGGLKCMRWLHSTAIEICRKDAKNSMIGDYISAWWDGIGSWRSPSLG